MERYMIWYLLQLKAWCRKKICWIQLVLLCILIWGAASISVPRTDNLNIGLCGINGIKSEEIAGILEQGSSIFTFCRYEDEDDMKSDIMSGRLECGFVFTDDFDNRLHSMQIDECIKYLETPFITKGKVARETVFAAFLQVYGERLLETEMPKLCGEYDEEVTQALLAKNKELISGEAVFEIEQQYVAVKKTEEKNSSSTYPIQGIVGLFIFGIIFMDYGRKYEPGRKSVCKALGNKCGSVFEGLGMLAAATPALVVGWGLIMCAGQHRNVIAEIISMLCFVVYSVLWTQLIGKFLKNRTTFMAWATTLLLIQVFLCPVFIDLAQYMKTIEYVRYLFPLGIYLML